MRRRESDERSCACQLKRIGSALSMSSSSQDKIFTVNGRALGTVIVLWWLLSLLVVRVVLAVPSAAPLLEAVQHTLPAARKFALASGFDEAATVFYCFFLITSPFVAVFYFRYTALSAALPGGVKLIIWFVLACVGFFMSVGVDMGPSDSMGFQDAFNTVLTSSWMGSSFIFLLFCHGFLICIVCIAKNKGVDSRERSHFN